MVLAKQVIAEHWRATSRRCVLGCTAQDETGSIRSIRIIRIIRTPFD